MMFKDYSTSAQAAYSSVMAAARQVALNRSPADLPGGFTRKQIKGRTYVYYQRKDPDGRPIQQYIGPDDEATQALVAAANDETAAQARDHLRKLVGAAEALGCYRVVRKHFLVLQRLADHGVFAAGAIVVGTHAFLAYQNLLGVSWSDAGSTVDLDFAHPGRNVSLAIAPEARVDVHTAVESLKMGFVPVNQGTRYVKPDEPDFDLDWLTSRSRAADAPVRCEALNVWLQPLRFMELSLEAPVPAAMMNGSSAIVVNLPRPQVYAVHKMLVVTERTGDHASKARKDLAQAAALMAYFTARDADTLRDVIRATRARGPAWRSALTKGLDRLRGAYPEVHEAVAGL